MLPTPFTSTLKTPRSTAVKNVITSLIIIYILHNFCSHMNEAHRTHISEGILERMEKLLTKVRSASLKRKESNLSRKEEKAKGKKKNDSNSDLKDIDSISISAAGAADGDSEHVENENDGGPSKRVSQDFSISTTPPGAYGSTYSLTEGPALITVEPLPKNSSRRSSLSKPGRKPSLQHVGFQSPELEPEEEEGGENDHTLTPTPSINGSVKKSKKHKHHHHHHMPSLISLISNATRATSKSTRSLRRRESTSTVRRLAAYKAVNDNFPTTRPAYIAIGSGALMLQIVERISQYSYNQLADVTFVSTGAASEHIMASYKLRPITSLNLLSPETKIDVYFDTADKVDDNLNCIRGRTGNLHLERMVALRSECFVCIIDYHKRVPTLFTNGKSMAVEITPESYFYVIKGLRGTKAIASLRSGEPAISGPCITQRGNYIIDATWPSLRDAGEEVEALAEIVKGIYGVVDHGLFYAGGNGWNGRPNKVYVGLEDGAVDTLG
ncbi:hypothetical protein AOL_s00076g391 [Orbilia oligospora ATCC 24927]|uniref:Ribose-5-phosphate isomerase n=1 Tax=Arthrobotrys oligospora (strain ATCC 24927 / CBS 115.81 / DSM 1491) TaxID=756982 RepID=G1XA08_ARTOA|nr:hypothetical protein AOL_s00076g391 [Orbilia oligospora ATCC 24927]EGX50040.1 hypothetical protein AOL_s00076g391 [Orbilia oligospora ATCC 24927]